MDQNTHCEVCTLRELRVVSKPMILHLYLPALLFLLILKIISWKTGIYMPFFTRDPLALTEAPPYYGLLSNIGVILWSSSVSLCLLARYLFIRKDPEFSRFMLASAGLTLLLLTDDLFQLHELVYPQLLGIPEIAIYIIYGILTLAYLTRFRLFIIRTPGVILILGGALFAASIGIDVFFESIPFQAELEDGAKFLGILSWTYAFAAFAFLKLRPAM